MKVKTLQVSKFKAGCLGLLKEVRATGDPLVVTLRGKTLVVIQPPDSMPSQGETSVAATLTRLHPLLLIEDEDFEPQPRTTRHSAADPLPI
jgi:prevent-host-death family protein